MHRLQAAIGFPSKIIPTAHRIAIPPPYKLDFTNSALVDFPCEYCSATIGNIAATTAPDTYIAIFPITIADEYNPVCVSSNKLFTRSMSPFVIKLMHNCTTTVLIINFKSALQSTNTFSEILVFFNSRKKLFRLHRQYKIVRIVPISIATMTP